MIIHYFERFCFGEQHIYLLTRKTTERFSYDIKCTEAFTL